MELLQIKNIDAIAVGLILTLLGSIEIFSNIYGKNSKRNKNDWYVELISTFQLFVLIKPIIYPLSAIIIIILVPNAKNLFLETNFLVSILMVIIIDDFLHYWYHRKSHEWNWLWKLHRPHHAAREMGVLVSYRNAFFFYILMPNIWWLGIATFIGLHKQVILAVIIKQIIVTGAHSELRWDRFLYSKKIFHPFAWLIERFISTPCTHFSHHGQNSDDGISNPNGNFGNMFFIWDIIFRTGLITRKYPKTFGIPDDPNDSWKSHLFYPIIKSKNENSEISN